MNTTIRKSIALFQNLRSLNGVAEKHVVDGKIVETFTPFDLDDTAIIAVARNMTILQGVLQDYNSAREMLVKSLGVSEQTKDNDPVIRQFEERLEKLLDQPAEVALHKVKLSALNLKKNRKLQSGIVADLIVAGVVVDDVPIEEEPKSGVAEAAGKTRATADIEVKKPGT